MDDNPVIFRIDDRLIHGQVLVGWGSHYKIKHIVVANNQIAANDWERNLLMMAAPSEIDVKVLPVIKSLSFIEQKLNDSNTSMILVRSPADVKIMAEKGLQIHHINVGGIHFDEGRREYLSYLFLNQKEVKTFRELIQMGYTFYCQDLPNGIKHNLEKLLLKQKW